MDAKAKKNATNALGIKWKRFCSSGNKFKVKDYLTNILIN